MKEETERGTSVEKRRIRTVVGLVLQWGRETSSLQDALGSLKECLRAKAEGI